MPESKKVVTSQLRSWGQKEKIIVASVLALFLVIGLILSTKFGKSKPRPQSVQDLLEPQQIEQRELPQFTQQPVQPTSLQTPSNPGPEAYIELPDGTRIPVKKSSGTTTVPIQPPIQNQAPVPPRGLALALKVYRDSFMGFALRIPEGWHVNATQGRILVKREPQALAGAVVYPVLLKQDMTALQFLKTCFEIYQNIYKQNQGTLSLDQVREESRGAQGHFTGMIPASTQRGEQGVQIQGEVFATVEGRRGHYVAYWAPTQDWATLKDVLHVVGSSFETFQGEPLKLYQGNVFQIYYPQGWQINETLNGIDVVDSTDQTLVSVALSMYLPGNPNPSQYMDFTLRLAEEALKQKGMQLLNPLILQQKPYPPMTDAIGQQWELGGREMQFDVQGVRYKAVLTSGILKQMMNFSGVISIRQAPLSRWEAVAPTLEAIEKSFKIIRGDLLGGGVKSMVLPANHPADTSSIMETWESQSASSDKVHGGWAEYMRGGKYVASQNGDDVWVTSNDYDPTKGGFVNPNNSDEVIPGAW